MDAWEAAARLFADQPAHEWECVYDGRDCPRDNARWRGFYDRVIVPIRENREWRDVGADGFAAWTARATRACRPVEPSDVTRGIGVAAPAPEPELLTLIRAGRALGGHSTAMTTPTREARS